MNECLYAGSIIINNYGYFIAQLQESHNVLGPGGVAGLIIVAGLIFLVLSAVIISMNFYICWRIRGIINLLFVHFIACCIIYA